MLKFIKHHIETISGIEVYPLISFVIFFVFFVGLIIYVIKADKKFIDKIANIPFESNDTDHEKA